MCWFSIEELPMTNKSNIGKLKSELSVSVSEIPHWSILWDCDHVSRVQTGDERVGVAAQRGCMLELVQVPISPGER